MRAVHRRSLLAGLGSVVGMAVVGRAVAATDDPPPGLPVTLVRSHEFTGAIVVERVERPLTHLALSWDDGTARPRMRLRDESGWREWAVPDGCGARPDHDVRWAGGVLVVANAATGYEIEGAGTALVEEIDVLGGPLRPHDPGAVQSDRFYDTPVRRYRNRASWGADESLRFTEDGTNRFPDDFHPVQTLTVHHTATGVDSTDPAATVRAVYRTQTVTEDFGDMGYHLLIDPAGTVYEGRASGTDPLPVFGPPTGGHLLVNTAAHVLSHNPGNIGVALLGDFTTAGPTPAARESLVTVLSILAALCDLDPTGRTDYVNPVTGTTATVDTICGHRDWPSSTECPGDAFHPDLPALRTDVARALSGPAQRP